MTMKERLRADLTGAMKARDELTASTLRMVLTAVTTEEVAGKQARVLSDDDVVKVLTREAKKRREAHEAYTRAGRTELAAREQAELGVIEGYLPQQLTEAEVAALVSEAIRDTGASGPQALGQVMKALSPKVAGRADGAKVAAEVRGQLAG
jgi:uncharacterized protein YqeY